jgi:hypothetical protein
VVLLHGEEVSGGFVRGAAVFTELIDLFVELDEVLLNHVFFAPDFLELTHHPFNVGSCVGRGDVCIYGAVEGAQRRIDFGLFGVRDRGSENEGEGWVLAWGNGWSSMMDGNVLRENSLLETDVETWLPSYRRACSCWLASGAMRS